MSTEMSDEEIEQEFAAFDDDRYWLTDEQQDALLAEIIAAEDDYDIVEDSERAATYLEGRERLERLHVLKPGEEASHAEVERLLGYLGPER